MKQLAFADRRRRDGKVRKRPGRTSRGAGHVIRAKLSRWNPMHVTLRAVPGLPSFRQPVTFDAMLRAIRDTRRPDFQIVEFSVQANHVHLLVEAEDKDALACGMKSFAVRATRLFNIATGRGRGALWSGRYHRADLTTPRQVRNALVYILGNARKHGEITTTDIVLDPCSSARWFEGWSLQRTVDDGPSPLPRARTPLLRSLWQRHGRIHPLEMPKAATASPRPRARCSRWC